MDQFHFLKVWGKFNLFLIFLFITKGLVLLNSENLFANSAKLKSDSGQSCNFCHLPYGSSNGSSNNPPLWNGNIQCKNFSSQVESESINQIQSSKLCLSCHDGTIAQDVAINPEKDGKPFGVDLGKSHPISVDYTTAYSRKGPKSFHHLSTLQPLKLYNGKVECGTCHDTHQSFRLRTSKVDLCFRCHNM
jgi:predicted CXXCH cytochrome family protein